jgi:hypothetical protein
MSSAPALSQSPSALDEDAWDDLLSFIEERRVIPIIGPELLMVGTDGGPRLLYDWVAEKLARRLNVDTSRLPQPLTEDVGCASSSRPRPPRGATRRAASSRTPTSARRRRCFLAAISDFDLFVSTTPDARSRPRSTWALRGHRHHRALAYSPNRVTDLPGARRAAAPGGLPLFGALGLSTYVISDEDCWSSSARAAERAPGPEKLFHELEHNHLLFIGSNFTNWLARLFLRMAKRQRLSDPRDVGEVLADDHTSGDARLMSFLQQVSLRTRVFVGAERFVEELFRRWQARRRPLSAAAGPAPTRFLPPAREMPEHAVFISYAREDLPAVQQLKAGLEAAGVTTWFDMERLESGDDFDRKIQRNIARCSYFIPVVSATTQRRLEGYFRREWSYALDRARNMADGALFILPVAVDDTDAEAALVPERFKALHFTRLPGGAVTPEFGLRLADFLKARVQ